MESPASAVSFESDVRPLFRERDQRSMRNAFDLWSYDDVKANASAILERVSDGTMPCDLSWSPDQVALLRSWIDADFPA
jgi:hypothetical protein